jgi:hypothetical protein
VNEPCAVCGEPTNEYSHAICSRCAQTFHLALRQDIPAKDCGQVWIDEDAMALDFACNTCLGLTPAGQTATPGAAAKARRYTRRDDTRASAIVRARRRRY